MSFLFSCKARVSSTSSWFKSMALRRAVPVGALLLDTFAKTVPVLSDVLALWAEAAATASCCRSGSMGTKHVLSSLIFLASTLLLKSGSTAISFDSSFATCEVHLSYFWKKVSAAEMSGFLRGVEHSLASLSILNFGVVDSASICRNSHVMLTSHWHAGTEASARGVLSEAVFSSVFAVLETRVIRSAASAPTPRMAITSYLASKFQKNSSTVVTVLLVQAAFDIPPTETSLTCLVGFSTSRVSFRKKLHLSSLRNLRTTPCV
mmetsp:Transcript_9500/g.17207  ORF Transcript_9500/g.17207 Transcript_9500/m.17207 type:complete len:263 (+) Transcript_9500:477-1265(+)